jgi:hypothetical protein
MSRPVSSKDLTETLQDVLTWCSKALLIGGSICGLLSVVLLIYFCFLISGDASKGAAAVHNIEIARNVVLVSVIGVAVGSGYMFWGEDLAPGIGLLLGIVLGCAPLYVPALLNNSSTTNDTIGSALGAVQTGGLVLGLLSFLNLAVTIGIRVKDRVKIGVKADQLKYGKGIKEEADKQNVFMGNCWQLPYCRKFVRERCPIFHAKTTCWKERVGCMCEEEVIRNALDNKPIPKDALLAAKSIPRNFRITEAQKVERCKNCVIYNEHQRHKYKLALPLVILAFCAIYGSLHGPLVYMTTEFIGKINDVVHQASLTGSGKPPEIPIYFIEGLLFVFMLVALTYVLKLLEFCVFKLKI